MGEKLFDLCGNYVILTDHQMDQQTDQTPDGQTIKPNQKDVSLPISSRVTFPSATFVICILAYLSFFFFEVLVVFQEKETLLIKNSEQHSSFLFSNYLYLFLCAFC